MRIVLWVLWVLWVCYGCNSSEPNDLHGLNIVRLDVWLDKIISFQPEPE